VAFARLFQIEHRITSKFHNLRNNALKTCRAVASNIFFIIISLITRKLKYTAIHFASIISTIDACVENRPVTSLGH